MTDGDGASFPFFFFADRGACEWHPSRVDLQIGGNNAAEFAADSRESAGSML